MTKPKPPDQAGPESPTKWSQPKQYTRDSKLSQPGRHAERDVFRTPSGHSIMAVDTEDGEALSVKHRSGAGLLIGPSGDITFTAHNGMFNMVFGENRMEVSGTYDVTVKGGGTLKVDGDYDCTIGGNMNFTVDNDINFKGKAMNMMATGNMDIVAQNITAKSGGGVAIHAEGATSITADGSVGLMSRGDSVAIAGATQVGIAAAGGEIALQSGGATHINAGGNILVDSSGDVRFQEGLSQKAEDLITAKPSKKPNIQIATGPRYSRTA
jgi:hypothetical protein